MNKSDISKLMAEYGRRGANAKMKKYGKEYLKEMSKKGVEARKNRINNKEICTK